MGLTSSRCPVEHTGRATSSAGVRHPPIPGSGCLDPRPLLSRAALSLTQLTRFIIALAFVLCGVLCPIGDATTAVTDRGYRLRRCEL